MRGALDPDLIADAIDTGFERRSPTCDPFEPRLSKWAAVVLREDEAPAKAALAPLLELRRNQGVAFDPDGPTPGLVVLDRPAADRPALWEEALRRAAGPPPHHLLLVGGRSGFRSAW